MATVSIKIPQPPLRAPLFEGQYLNPVWQRWLIAVTSAFTNTETVIDGIVVDIPTKLSDLNPRPYEDLQFKPGSLSFSPVTDISTPSTVAAITAIGASTTLDVVTDISTPITLEVVTDVTQDAGTKDITVTKATITYTEGTLTKLPVIETEGTPTTSAVVTNIGTITKTPITYLEG